MKFTLNYAKREKTEVLKIALAHWIKAILKKYFPFEVNITHQSMHFMCSLLYLAHKGYTPYFFQVAKIHFQLPRSLCSVCTVQQDDGCPRKAADDNRPSKPRDASLAGSEWTAQPHTWVTSHYHGVCIPLHSQASQFAIEPRAIEQQQLALITLDGSSSILVPIKTI